MDAKKRARLKSVAGILSAAVPAGTTTIMPGSGPTLAEIVTGILSIEAVTTVKGDAATAAAAGMAHVSSGRAQAISDALQEVRATGKPARPRKVFSGGGLVINATIDQIVLEITVPGKTGMLPSRETIMLSHADHRCILKEDCDKEVDMDRLDAHLRVLADEIHSRDDRGMTVGEVLEQLREKTSLEMATDFVRLYIPGVDWNVTALHRNQINHQSIEAWRMQVRAGINPSELSMEPKAHIVDKAAALVNRLNAELVRQGRLPEAYQESRGGTVCVGMPVLSERLTIVDRSMNVDYGATHLERQLKAGEDGHVKLMAMLEGRQPAKTPDEVALEIWRFDPVLLRLVDIHSRDPEDSLRRVVFGPNANHYHGPSNPIGPGAPDFTSRVSKLEATIRVQIADGIAWSNGSVTINMKKVAIPEQLIGAMGGRRLGEILSHPLLDADAEIVNATLSTGENDKSKGTVTLQTRRHLVRAADVIRPHRLAA